MTSKTMKSLGVQVSRGPNVRGPSVPGVQVSLGSKCRRGPSVPGVQVSLGSKCRRGPSVPGVQMSPGSKCPRGPNVPGVQVSLGSNWVRAEMLQPLHGNSGKVQNFAIIVASQARSTPCLEWISLEDVCS